MFQKTSTILPSLAQFLAKDIQSCLCVAPVMLADSVAASLDFQNAFRSSRASRQFENPVHLMASSNFLVTICCSAISDASLPAMKSGQTRSCPWLGLSMSMKLSILNNSVFQSRILPSILLAEKGDPEVHDLSKTWWA